ncbi:hypothetical protein WMF31_39160 [Sorangium sp. So ce1036]|uniref:hypothetical protein n=1 Tax=Sorangium sp. So ce1036 TaxID=3133328 RepID=UPI003EFC31CA
MGEPERRDEDPDHGPGGVGKDRAPLGILFLAAAFALALLLTVIGLLAFTAMTPRSPPGPSGEHPGAGPARGAGSSPRPALHERGRPGSTAGV